MEEDRNLPGSSGEARSGAAALTRELGEQGYFQYQVQYSTLVI